MKAKPSRLPVIKLTISFFREGRKFIAYCPSLDLSAYGKTFDHARRAFEETAEIFFEELSRKGALETVLTECGWKKVRRPRVAWLPPSFITNIEKEIALPT